MGKFLRIIISIILTAIILIIAAIIIVVTLVNPNDYKDKISAVVKQQTGRNLIIGGKIHWSLYPRLGVKVNNVTFNNAKGFENKTFAKIGEADINVRLIPLFTGKIRAGTITLKNTDLYLTKNKNGQTNWQDLLQKQPAAQPTPTNKKELATKTALITISSIDIVNANIYWNNKQNNQTATIKNCNFSTSSIQLNKPIYVKTDLKFSATNPSYAGKIHFSSKITTSPKQKQCKLDNINLSGNIKSNQLKTTEFNITGNINFDGQKQSFSIANMEIKINDMTIKGEISGSQSENQFKYSGNLLIPTFNPQTLLSNAGITPKNKRTLRSAGAKINFNGTSNKLNIPNIFVTFDKSKLQGNISSINFNKKAISFDLKLDQINLNNYQLKTNTKKRKTTKTTAKKGSKNIQASSQWSENGNIRINSLTAGKTRLSNFSAHLTSNNGITSLKSIRAGLYQGSLSGQVTVNTRKTTPSFSSITTLSGIQLASLLKDFANSNKVTGKLYFNAKLSGAGSSANNILRTLNGTGKLQVSNGYLKGIDVKYQLRKAVAIYKKIFKQKSIKNIQDAFGLLHQVLAKKIDVGAPNTRQTYFGKITGSFLIRNGLLCNNDLLVISPDFQAKGQGTANLPHQHLNYLVQVTSPHLTLSDNQKTKPIQLPIAIKGPFNNLSYHPDFSPIAKQAGQQAVKAFAQKTVQQIVGSGKDIGKNLQKHLKSIGKLFH